MNMGKKENGNVPKTFESVEEFDKVCKGAIRELHDFAGAMIKALDKKRNPNLIRNKRDPRIIHLSQPIAQLACSGLLDNIEVSYIENWKKEEVLLVYADDQTPESKEKFENDKVLFAKYFNAVAMGNQPELIVSEAFIGLIRLGHKITKENKKQFIDINGAELFDEPFDDLPTNVTERRTHVFQYKNITLAGNIVKIPISKWSLENMINDENYFLLLWERKFEGLTMFPNDYDYLFYTDNTQLFFTPRKKEKKDDEEEDAIIYRAKKNDGKVCLFFDLDKFSKKILNENSIDFLQKKEWILDWECVTFKNDIFVVKPPKNGNVNFMPLTVYKPGVKESYNYLKKYLNDKVAPIRCTVENMKLTINDTISLDEAIVKFAVISNQRPILSTETVFQTRTSPMQMSFKQALSKAQQMTPAEFTKYKSEFINFLLKKQSDKYKVIPCLERLAHVDNEIIEEAFMFSLKEDTGKILIVYENVNPDRSTLLFEVEEKDYDLTVQSIYDFLQSAEINKRSNLRSRNIELKEANVKRFRSINHDSSWKYSIKSCLEYNWISNIY